MQLFFLLIMMLANWILSNWLILVFPKSSMILYSFFYSSIYLYSMLIHKLEHLDIYLQKSARINLIIKSLIFGELAVVSSLLCELMIVLYECMMLHSPFEQTNVAAIFYAILHNDVFFFIQSYQIVPTNYSSIFVRSKVPLYQNALCIVSLFLLIHRPIQKTDPPFLIFSLHIISLYILFSSSSL